MKSHRILLCCSLLMAGLYAAPAAAQPEKDNGKPRVKRPRSDLGRPHPRGQRARGADAQLEALSKALNLDDAQRTEIGALLRAHAEKAREIRRSIRPSDADREEMMKIRDDMKRARDEQNKQLMEECRQRMHEIREAQYQRGAPARKELEQAETKLHDDVFATLNDEQKSSFEDVWAKVMQPRGRRGVSKYDPRFLKRVVLRLKDLSPDQKIALNKLFDDFHNQHPDARRARGRKPRQGTGDKADNAPKRNRRHRRGMRDDPAAKKLYEDVMAQLTDTQKKDVEQVLERAHGKRGRRGAGRGPGARGRFPGSDRPQQPPTDNGDK